MAAFSEKEIRYIRFELRRRGVSEESLVEELIDHVCCEIEKEMESGTAFKPACEKILNTVSPPQLTELQNNTIKAANYNVSLMLRNTTRLMFRNIRKHRLHSFINIGGLSVGLACFLIIALYTRHEVSYDTQFAKSSSIYRVVMSSTVGGTTNTIPTAYPTLSPEIMDRFADVKKYVRIINYKYTRLVPTFRNEDKIFYEENVIFADSTLFDLFDFPFLEGNAKTSLLDINSVVITEKMARKYFGESSALGKHLLFNEKTELEISGVLKDLPSNTHLQFDFVIPMSNLGSSGTFLNTKALESWNIDWFWNYLLIPDARAVPRIEEGVNKLASERIKVYQTENNVKFYVQSLKDIHLHSDFDYNTDLTQNGNIQNLYIFISVGVLVLLMSAINFVNLTMATATRRFKEIGISKVLGALRSQLRFQFLYESVVVCLMSLVVGVLLAQLMLPLFSGLLGIPLQLDYVSDAPLLGVLALFTVVVGALAGAYPAFFVSAFEPQQVLKGVWKPGTGGANFRKVLVGLQIAVAIFLIIGSVVIWEQLTFMQNKSLGYDKDQIIMLRVRGTNLSKSFYSFKNNLLNESAILNVSSVSEPVGREVQFMTFAVEGQQAPQNIKILNVTGDFVNTMGLQIVKGRDFNRGSGTDSTSGFIINEAAAKAFGWKEPIGKAIDHSFRKEKKGAVIGVVKDFNFEPLQKQIDPIVIWFGWPGWFATVKIQKGKAPEALALIEREWKSLEPSKPFAFQFLDQSIQSVYEKEQRLSNVFLLFAFLSILTSVMGLFGLISFVSEQRMAEIGIRKVMGASVRSILYLLSKEYILLTLIAFAVAAPLTYFIVNHWLMSFSFRIGWDVSYFIVGLIVSGTIVIATVVLKGFGAARSNPAKTLRSE